MIKLQDYTPEVYYKESRDFQLIGRLYDLILNYSKTNAGMLYYLPLSQNSDDQFIELLAYTLGFKQKHSYTAKHLRAICSVFSEILRNKGSIKSVLLACGAIMHSEGIDKDIDYELSDNNTALRLYLPPELNDTTLLSDLMDYILPAGMACNIVKLVIANRDATTKIGTADSFKLFGKGDYEPKSHTGDGSKYMYDSNVMSILPRYIESADTDRESGIIKASDTTKPLAEDTLGVFANSSIYKPQSGQDESSDEEDDD